MKFWSADEATDYDTAPTDVWNLVNVTCDVLSRSADESVRFLRIGRNDGGFQDDCYQVDLEIAPGLVLPTMIGSMENLELDVEHATENQEMLEYKLERALARCQPDLDSLANIVHDARLRARAVIARWNAEGVPTRLMDLSLAPLDQWESDDAPTLLVTVEQLDDILAPEGFPILIYDAPQLERELEGWKEHVGDPYETRTAMAAKGASGSIDQTALNVLAHFGGVSDGLRRLKHEQRFWFPDGTVISSMCGHVHTASGGSGNNVDLTGEYLTVHSTFLPAEQLKELIGRPATELLEHAFLSSDNTILEAKCTVNDGQPKLTIKISNPIRLFCSTSGRVWDDVTTNAAPAVPDNRDPGSVIPIRQPT